MPTTDPTQRFSSRVDNYIRYRPSYPQAVLETLTAACRLTPSSIVADVGSGTGLLSKIFLDHGNPVIGVEPNPDMRHAGEQFLADYRNFTSVAATAEATTLPAHSVDFITAGQAAHWFNLEKARREFVRILKPGAWTALIWNERKTDSTPFLAAYENLLLTYGTDYQEIRHERTSAEIDTFFAPAQFQSRVFPYQQLFDYESLEGRLLSSSYTPQPGDPNHTPMLHQLRRIFDHHQSAGRVAFEYDTRMFYGQLA